MNTEQMTLTVTCCQDHTLLENIWFVWSETSYSGDERRCYRCGTNKRPNTEDRATQPMEAGGWVSQNSTETFCLGLCEKKVLGFKYASAWSYHTWFRHMLKGWQTLIADQFALIIATRGPCRAKKNDRSAVLIQKQRQCHVQVHLMCLSSANSCIKKCKKQNKCQSWPLNLPENGYKLAKSVLVPGHAGIQL